MSQEDKELLLKDLSARLTYGVKIQVKEWTTLDTELKVGHINRLQNDDIELKPYLRSMSSMTEEEKVEYYNTMDKETQRNYPNSCDFSESVYYSNTIKTFDWLNAHHFDYRGLIEKGLALEAPEGMYNDD